MLTPCFSTLGCVDYSLDAILALARDHGIPALELRGMEGALLPTAIPSFAPSRIAATAAKLVWSLRPAVYGASINCTDIYRQPGKLSAALNEIAYAAALGFPCIRVFGNHYLDEDEAVSITAAVSVLRDLCAEAAPRGVTVLLETHGDFVRADTFTELCSRMAGVENFGLIWDIAHTDRVYGDNWPVFWEALRPYIKHVHVKDHRRDGSLTQIGEGDIPLVPILRRLDADGFDGCVSLEWERKWHPELPPIEAALEAFMTTLKEADVW